MKQAIALLPIKEHSERVKGKNFRNICGKTLYQWILEELLKCQNISDILIDTDSEKFIQELKDLYPNVRTILRPEAIRGGMVAMNDIIAYDMSMLPEATHFIQTHTTNPLLKAKTIDRAINQYFNTLNSYDSLFSVNRIQARTYWKDATPINHEMGKMLRTQDLEPVMEENSNIFIFSRDSFKAGGGRIGVKPFLFETPKMESFEIDDEKDFELVQTLLEQNRRH